METLMVSRAQRTPFGEWWWTVDRLTLGAIGALMLTGVVLSLAASPPVAGRLGLEPFYFVNRHVLFLIPTLFLLLGTSFLSPRNIRRVAFIVFIVSILLIAATLMFGAEVKGARRWIVILGVVVLFFIFPNGKFVPVWTRWLTLGLLACISCSGSVVGMEGTDARMQTELKRRCDDTRDHIRRVSQQAAVPTPVCLRFPRPVVTRPQETLSARVNPDFLLGGRMSASAECRREGSPLVKLRNSA